MSIPRTTDSPQPMAFKCDCGSKSQEVLRRYQVLRCTCGKFWWVLQPKRNGSFRFFPWPGPNLTNAEMREKEAAHAL